VLRVRLEVTLATHPIHINEADKMDGDIGGMIFEPEQMQMLNALFVLILIPIFDKGLYPLVALLSSRRTSLDPVGRMLAGMTLGSVAFLAAAGVQHMIDSSPPGSVSMSWQVPQYLIITCGEVLFSITGLEYAFSRAPASMKSLVAAAWLCTTAVGNIVTVVMVETVTRDMDQVHEFLLFSGGCLGESRVVACRCAW